MSKPKTKENKENQGGKLRVIHLVPSAFEYFDDIKKNAFEIVERISAYDVESTIVTLQYNHPTREEKETLTTRKGAAPSYKFKGTMPIDEALNTLSDYDLVHLHCPFLGAGGRIYRWKKKDKDTPLLVTYYRPVNFPDLLSVFIWLYNRYYLPKILRLADIVTIFPASLKKKGLAGVKTEQMIDITPENPKEDSLEVDLTNYSNEVKLNKAIISRISISKLIYLYSLLYDKA